MAAFQRTEGSLWPLYFSGRTRYRVRLETKLISAPSSGVSTFRDITNTLITPFAKGTPESRNTTVFGRNLNVNVARGQRGPLTFLHVRVCTSSWDPTRLPHVIDTPNILSAHPVTSPPIILVSNVLQTLVAGDEQWEPTPVRCARPRILERVNWTTCLNLS